MFGTGGIYTTFSFRVVNEGTASNNEVDQAAASTCLSG
jgi:hypothetical protein